MNIGLGFVFALSTPLLVATAEGQATPPSPPSQNQSSLADYARKVHKDTGATKAQPKVFDNDNLPKDDKLSIVGQRPVAAAEGATEKPAASPDGKTATEAKPAGEAKSAAAAEDEKAKKQAESKAWQDKLSAQKDQVSMASRELDVTQREYQLRAAAMYADVGNRLRNSTQWDKEEATYKTQIADKQKALDDAKQKLEDMKEEAHKAGMPSSITD
jgi:hypothetical protein